jgi:hypothetical protein
MADEFDGVEQHLALFAECCQMAERISLNNNLLTDQLAEEGKGGWPNAVLGGMLLALGGYLMDDDNAGDIERLVSALACDNWPAKVEVRRRLDSFLDGLGLVDDTHLYN